MEERNCICGTSFISSVSNIKKGGGKFCSRKCYFSNSKPWNFGKSWSKEIKEKISKAQIGKRIGKDNQSFSFLFL